jgi:long-chain fatty acid transport protein
MKNSNRIMRVCVAAALAGWSAAGSAAGFQLIEQNASGLGNAYAGQAATAEDASTIFFNPAGMSRLNGNQFVIGVDGIKPSAQFSNSSSTVPTIPGAAPLGGVPYALGPNGKDAGDWAYVPNMYFSMQLNPQWNIGLGVSAPFGLKTEYDPNWVGRFYAIKSEVKTYNINPSVSYKVNDVVSLGAGLNYQHISAEISNGVNYSAVAASAIAGGAPLGVFLPIAQNPAAEGVANLSGSDNAWGYNLGAMFNLTPDTRLGLSYRSQLKYTLTGTVSFTNTPAAFAAVPAVAAQVAAGAISADIKLPDSFSAALFSKVNSQWDVMADFTWTHWALFQNLTFIRSTGVVLGSTPENWSNTWRVGVGANYHYDDAWTWRIGTAYDQSPVSDAFRTPRIPDNNRTWLSIGTQYKFTKSDAIDFGYAHLWVSSGSINLPAAGYPATTLASSGSLVGSSKNKVDIVGIQYRHTF